MASLTYILAASHSGSTLLAMLLGSHQDACTVGELKATNLGDPERYRCSCGSLIRQCPFWCRVRERMSARGIPFDIADAGTHFGSVGGAYAQRLLRPLHRGPLLERCRDAALSLSPRWRRALPGIQQRNLALVEVVCEIRRARTIIDSSKVGLRLKYLLRTPGLDVKVVRLVRDGRAVALTYTDPSRFADAKDPTLRGGGSGGSRDGERLGIRDAAREWRRSNEEAECLLAGLAPSQWTQVRYEDLCAEPDGVLSRLFTFLGLDPAWRAKEFRSVEHHVLGNGMRLDSTSEIRLDDRWRSALSAEDLRIFDSVAGDLDSRYGYF